MPPIPQWDDFDSWIQLEYCPTDDMIVDIMTKPLTRDRHLRLMEMIGMQSTTASPFEASYQIRKAEHDKEKDSDTESLELEWECWTE